MNPLIVAIDPGKNGGLAIGTADCVCPTLEKMPASVEEFHYLIRRLKHTYGHVEVVMERVGGFIGRPQPGSRMFVFGQNYGELRGVVIAHDLPLTMVVPQVWQRKLGIGNSAGMPKPVWKNKLKSVAQELFPKARVTLGTADALLIWHTHRDSLPK